MNDQELDQIFPRVPQDQLTSEERSFAEDGDGVWRTIRGRRVFIKKGESVQDALKRSLEDESKKVMDDFKRREKEWEAKVAKDPQIQDIDRQLTDLLNDPKMRGLERKAKEDELNRKRAAREKEVAGDRPEWNRKADEELLRMNRGDREAKQEKKHTEAELVVTLAHSNAIRGVEIFATGKHNGDDYTEKDIDDMIEAFKALDFRPAIKVGHTKDSPGAPAYGWVTNLRKVGGKLVADFEAMHDSVVEAIKNRNYDRVSSEIYFNLKRGGKMFRRALKAVALLGADVPAVAGLKPLHKMEFAADGFETVAACSQNLEVEKQAIIDALAERVAGLNQTLIEQKEQDAMKIKELQEKRTALETQLAALRGKTDLNDEDKAAIAKLSLEIGDLGKKIDGEIATLTAAAAESEALKAQVASLAAKDRAREVDERVGRCTVKAFQADLRALYSHAVANPAVKVKHFSVDKDGKQVESEKTLSESLDSLVASINAGAAKLFVVGSNAGASRREEGPSDNPGAEVDEKAKARVRDGKSKSYDEALDAVLAEDRDLAKRYHEQQSAVRAG